MHWNQWWRLRPLPRLQLRLRLQKQKRLQKLWRPPCDDRCSHGWTHSCARNRKRIKTGYPLGDRIWSRNAFRFWMNFFVTYSSWRELEWFPLFPEGSRIGTPLVPCTWPPAVTKNWKPRNHRLESPGQDHYPSRVWNLKQNMFFDCGIIGDIWTNINICCEHSFQGWHITARFSTPKQKFNFLGKCTAKCQIQMQLFSDFR